MKPIVKVLVKGGAVQAVRGVGAEYPTTVEVHDYDVEGVEPEDLDKDESGIPYQLRIFHLGLS